MLINKITSLVDGVTISVTEVALAQGVLAILYLARPVSLEVSQNVILVECSLVDGVRLVFDPSLHVLHLDHLSHALGLRIPLEELDVLFFVVGEVEVTTDAAQLDSLRCKQG